MFMVKGRGLTSVETDKTEYNSGKSKNGSSVFSFLISPIGIHLSYPK